MVGCSDEQVIELGNGLSELLTGNQLLYFCKVDLILLNVIPLKTFHFSIIRIHDFRPMKIIGVKKTPHKGAFDVMLDQTLRLVKVVRNPDTVSCWSCVRYTLNVENKVSR